MTNYFSNLKKSAIADLIWDGLHRPENPCRYKEDSWDCSCCPCASDDADGRGICLSKDGCPPEEEKKDIYDGICPEDIIRMEEESKS